jgi:hypothetical protein
MEDAWALSLRLHKKAAIPVHSLAIFRDGEQWKEVEENHVYLAPSVGDTKDTAMAPEMVSCST